MADKTTDHAAEAAWFQREIAPAAMDKYVELTGDTMGTDRDLSFVRVILKQAAHIPYEDRHEIVVNPGVAWLGADRSGQVSMASALWAMHLNVELPEDGEHDGLSGLTIQEAGPEAAQTMQLAMQTITKDGGEVIVLGELLAWLSIADAQEDGDEALAGRIYRAAFVHAGVSRMFTIRGSAPLSAIMAVDSKKQGVVSNGDDESVSSGDLTLYADQVGQLTADTGTGKTLLWLIHLANASGYRLSKDRACVVETTLAELLEKRGLEDTPGNRKRAKKDVEALSRWGFEWRGKHEFGRINLATSAQVKRGGRITFSFTPESMAHLMGPHTGMPRIPEALLKVDERYRKPALQLGFKLVVHSYLNMGEGTEHVLSVAKLLESARAIPSRDEVSGRAYTRQIIQPLELNLDHLVEIGVLKGWDYCHAKGEPLTDAEQDARLKMEDGRLVDTTLPYEIAISANIWWELADQDEGARVATLTAREKNRALASAGRSEADKQAKNRERRIQSKAEKIVAEGLAADELKRRRGQDGDAASA